ncbi:MAG: drug/metabolite transporter (DMT)-like permease [Motiliproteus sp.]|jgi:drug/metabolite transporter (DMT)-like permease
MNTRTPLDSMAVSLMVFFCLCLGLQQIALKVAAPNIAPVLQLALRSGISAGLVALYMYLRGERLTLADGNWKLGLMVGVLFTLEYLFLGQALEYTSASHTVVFLYTSPIFAAFILHFLVESEKMAPLQWLGIALAFLGIVLAFLGPQSGAILASTSLLGDGLALLAGAAWGLATVLIRTSRLARVSPKETLLYQLITAFVLLSLSAAALDQLTFNVTPVAVASLAFQSVIVSFVAFLIWFWLLRHYPASQVGVLSLMTPLFGVALGGWLLSESIEPAFLNGALMVIVGIILVSGHAWLTHMLYAWRKARPRKS